MFNAITIGKWFKIGLFNLALVALYGMTMRYKIAFNFPYFDQRNLLHAHSHFAFSGWISHFLYTGLFYILQTALPTLKYRRYNMLIAGNLLCSFGMLLAFTLQGYQIIAISFSTLTIIFSILIAWNFINDTRTLNASWKPWAVTGLLLNVISAAGPFYLAYMMATKTIQHEWYLASIYYYLHFQYNGWFFFAGAAIAIHMLPPLQFMKKMFLPFVLTVVPSFCLSTLWANIPGWLYFFTTLAAIIQLFAWLTVLPQIKSAFKQQPCNYISILFFTIVAALTLKFTLQAISVIPSLNQLVFGFRPIVIAYLHLVLLGIYSIFIIAYLMQQQFIPSSRISRFAVLFFLTGVVLNESLLAIQGIAAFSYTSIPYINELLWIASVLLLLGALCIFCIPFNKQAITGNRLY